MQLYHVLLHVHETWKLKKVHRGLNRSLQSTEKKNKKPQLILTCFLVVTVEICTYCAKLTTKANFSDECNVIGNGKFQETEMRKKKKNRLIIFQLLHPISIMGPKTRQINQERSILKECKLKVTGCTGRIHNTIFIFIRYVRVDGMQIISD